MQETDQITDELRRFGIDKEAIRMVHFQARFQSVSDVRTPEGARQFAPCCEVFSVCLPVVMSEDITDDMLLANTKLILQDGAWMDQHIKV